jgi:hypothetical protein
VILQAYPYSFRREFGSSMAQVFADAVRDAWRDGGIGGLMVLWMKTGRDVVVSLARAYAAEARHPPFRRAASAILLDGRRGVRRAARRLGHVPPARHVLT